MGQRRIEALVLQASSLLLTLLLIAGPAGAEEQCPGSPVEIGGASPEERQMVCEAVRHALELLGKCEISPQGRIRIDVVDRVRDPFGRTVLGLFDPKTQTVLIPRLAAIPALVADTPYARLASRDFYKSMIVHETTHAVMLQASRRKWETRSAYEYPAYALQIASLPPSAREKLGSKVLSAPRDNILFNDILLSFDPYDFAVRAYEHFVRDGKGCAHLTALLDGQSTDFIVTLP